MSARPTGVATLCTFFLLTMPGMGPRSLESVAPAPAGQTLMWTAGVYTEAANYSWDYAVQVAAAHVEEVNGVVYDDWRLPTPEEFIAAVNDGSIAPIHGSYYWTSAHKGRRWAYAGSATVDANGVPFPGTAVITQLGQGAGLKPKFVRP